MSTLTAKRIIRNLLIPQTLVRELPTVKAGDIVRDADGSLCCVERIGWTNGEVSPFYGDKTLRAYVWGFNEDGSVWVEWCAYTALSADDVSDADIDKFCAFVKRNLESHKRASAVVAAACGCE